MFPLLIGLFDLDDVGEEATVDFGENDFVADEGIGPVPPVLEGQIQNESS